MLLSWKSAGEPNTFISVGGSICPLLDAAGIPLPFQSIELRVFICWVLQLWNCRCLFVFSGDSGWSYFRFLLSNCEYLYFRRGFISPALNSVTDGGLCLLREFTGWPGSVTPGPFVASCVRNLANFTFQLKQPRSVCVCARARLFTTCTQPHACVTRTKTHSQEECVEEANFCYVVFCGLAFCGVKSRE